MGGMSMVQVSPQESGWVGPAGTQAGRSLWESRQVRGWQSEEDDDLSLKGKGLMAERIQGGGGPPTRYLRTSPRQLRSPSPKCPPSVT